MARERRLRSWLVLILAFASAVPASAQLDADADELRNAAFTSYVIGPSDVLDVEVFELEELSKTVRVSGEGTISYPMLGIIVVSGLTKFQLEARMAELLSRRYIKDPQVTVFIREMKSGNVMVLGAVVDPGGVSLIGTGTVLDALGRAGGTTRDAGHRAFLIRADRSSSTVIDLRRLLEAADLTMNLPVAAGDVLYVPKARLYKVFVYGQVLEPGEFEVQEGDEVTVLQAVAMAGGLGRRAKGKVKVVRATHGMQKRTFEINLSKVIEGKAADFALQEGDIVVVPKSFF